MATPFCVSRVVTLRPRHFLAGLLILFISHNLFSQNVGINDDASTPDPSAILDIKATDRGLLIPRTDTATVNGATSPATGLLIFQNSDNAFYYYNGSHWSSFSEQASFSLVVDADGDTKIQVEESADEDIIRFDLGGTEAFIFQPEHIEMPAGSGVYIGKNTVPSADPNLDGVGIGPYAFESLTSGYGNVALGSYNSRNVTTGSGNTAIGGSALYSLSTGDYNVALGESALATNNTGQYNVAIGNNAGYQNKGSGNIFIGYRSGVYEPTANDLLFIDNSDTRYPLIWGDFANNLVHINGTLSVSDPTTGNVYYSFPVTDGSANQVLQTDGAGNITWATINGASDTLMLIQDADRDTKIQVEQSADDDIIRFDLGGTEYLTLESGRIIPQNTGGTVSIGDGAGLNDDGTNNYNVFIGRLAGRANTSGSTNVAIGNYALIATTTGGGNIALGSAALRRNNSGSSNIALGGNALFETLGSGNIAIGSEAGRSATGSDNIFLGFEAGKTETGSDKLYIENSSSAYPLIGGDFASNTVSIHGGLSIANASTGNNYYTFPLSSGTANQFLQTDGSGTLTWSNPASDTLTILHDTDHDTKIQLEESSDEDYIRFDVAGNQAMVINSLGQVGIGLDTPSHMLQIHGTMLIDSGRIEFTGLNNNIGIGNEALENNPNWGNIALGYRAFWKNAGGSANTILGHRAFESGTAGYQNVAVGKEALRVNAGSRNTVVGTEAGENSTGQANVFLGYQAGHNELDDSKLYIENSSSAYPLIKGDFDADSVIVHGRFAIADPTDGSLVLNFPTSSGTSGQTLEADGAGNLAWVNNLASSPPRIADADNDTKIQVEESADEDIIRFDLGGTEHFRMTGARLEVVNSNECTFIGHNAGLKTESAGTGNTFMGENSGMENLYGMFNVAFGQRSLEKNTLGGFNTALGTNSLGTNTMGDYNVAVGLSALKDNIMGAYSTAIGAYAGETCDNQRNVFVGAYSGQLSVGDNNIFIGTFSGRNHVGSDQLIIENSASTTPLIYGDFATDSLMVNGSLSIGTAFTFPTSDGSSGQYMATDGTGNLSWTSPNALKDDDSDTRIQVEETADEDIIRFDMAGTEYFRMTGPRLEVLNTDRSVFFGEEAGLNTDPSSFGNNFIGYRAGKQNTTGAANIALGAYALENNTASNSNLAIGAYSMSHKTSGTYNMALGYQALRDNLTGSYNVSLGNQSGIENTGSNNVFLGYRTGQFSDGSGNIFIGKEAGRNSMGDNLLIIENSSSTSPLIYGDFASDALTINGSLSIGSAFTLPTTDGTNGQVLQTDGSGNVTWSSPSNTFLADNDNDTKIQVEESTDEDLIRLDIAGNEEFVFYKERIQTNGSNVSIGNQAGANLTSGSSNVAIGRNSLTSNLTGGSNVSIGVNAGADATGSTNVFLGTEAGRYCTGSSNVFIGKSAGENETGSNLLYIDNSNTQYPLIGGNFSVNYAYINGFLELRNPTDGSRMLRFPVTTGSIGQHMINDGNNRLIWADPITDDMGDHTAYQNLEMNGNWISNDGDNEGMFVDTDGKVGIGLNGPGRQLHIYGDGGARFENETNGRIFDISPGSAYIDLTGGVMQLNRFSTKNISLCRGGGDVIVGNYTSNTVAKLQVEGTGTNSTCVTGYGYLESGGAGNNSGNLCTEYSILASNKVGALNFLAYSDERIKHIKGQSNSQEDLEILSQIQVTDYTFVDTIENATTPQKKVIAQQVKSVYPQAVDSHGLEIIPDIFARAEISKEGWVALPTDLTKGDLVQLIFPDEKRLFTVLDNVGDQFQVDTSYAGEIFVYGRQVQDFHSVDYEAISMLNVSATQELYKQLLALQEYRTQQEKNHYREIEELKREMNAKLAAFEARFAQLEHLLPTETSALNTSQKQ